ncbi:hypothetical protein [Motiliproteus sp.]|uniref:hypothetical protein n=1 Tax=Motiliproteus sp. TaxID=1898955 RepID=UPI003BA9276A
MLDESYRNQYVQVTPAGAYYATLNSAADDARTLLLQLLSADIALPYSNALITGITGLSPEPAAELFDRLYRKGFFELFKQPTAIVDEGLEKMLPELLPALSSTGRAVLADDQGFCLGCAGFEEPHAEALSALTADLIMLYERHHQLLDQQLGVDGESWGLLDPLGQSQLGFWIVHIGSKKFALIIDQTPQLNQAAMVELLSALARRYIGF